jgi:sugar lactone lactonase YvrE
MMAKHIWQIEIPGSFHTPRLIYVIPELNSFYFSDYLGIRVRKFSLGSGEETASLAVRGNVVALDIDSKRREIMLNTDKKIFLLNTELQELKRWETRVPSAMQFTLRFGPSLVMKCWSDDKFVVFDLATSKISRKKCGVGGPLLRDIRKNSALIGCGLNGAMYRFNVQRAELSELFSDLFFDEACLDSAGGSIWLYSDVQMGGSYEPVKRKGSMVCRVSASDGRLLDRFELPFHPREMSLSADGAHLWFVGQERRLDAAKPNPATVRIFSTKDFKELGRFEFPREHKLTSIDATSNFALTETGATVQVENRARMEGKKTAFALHGWRLK